MSRLLHRGVSPSLEGDLSGIGYQYRIFTVYLIRHRRASCTGTKFRWPVCAETHSTHTECVFTPSLNRINPITSPKRNTMETDIRDTALYQEVSDLYDY